MRRLVVALVLAVGLAIPSAVGAIDPPAPGPDQQVALNQPDVPYLRRDGNPCGIEFTPNQARAWWVVYFANPVDLSPVRPALLPGSLVLTPDEYRSAVALNARGNTLTDAPRDYNPLSLPVTPGLVIGAGGITFCTDQVNLPAVALPTALPSAPLTAAVARLRTYIARLSACACNPSKLATYQARLTTYLAR